MAFLISLSHPRTTVAFCIRSASYNPCSFHPASRLEFSDIGSIACSFRSLSILATANEHRRPARPAARGAACTCARAPTCFSSDSGVSCFSWPSIFLVLVHRRRSPATTTYRPRAKAPIAPFVSAPDETEASARAWRLVAPRRQP